MARLKVPSAVYLALSVLGLVAAVLVPVVIYRGGTMALPVWSSIASPGPLSSSHAFLGEECESCHTPNLGVRAASCITCHAPAPLLLDEQSTAFHATVGECRGCHIEHLGVDRRPIKMDHSVLMTVGMRAARAEPTSGQPLIAPARANESAVRQFLATATGGAPAMDAKALNCASCHSLKDVHLGFFGQQCAECHTTEAWKIAGYLHPSPRSEDCNQCHKAPVNHYMMPFLMMAGRMTGERGATVEQCFACHKTDSFNDLRGAGWFKMH